jgi:hypothetical protein
MRHRMTPHLKLVVVFACVALANGSFGCARGAMNGDNSQRIPRMEIFILPAGYRGPFLAVYGDTASTQATWRADTAFYSVPPHGVVRVPHPEPPRSTRTSLAFSNDLSKRLDNYPTCEDMRASVTDSLPRVCWFGYSYAEHDTPDHIVAVVTDWAGIPVNFNRTAFVYDSVLFHGRKKMNLKWEEPAETLKRRQGRTQ